MASVIVQHATTHPSNLRSYAKPPPAAAALLAAAAAHYVGSLQQPAGHHWQQRRRQRLAGGQGRLLAAHVSPRGLHRQALGAVGAAPLLHAWGRQRPCMLDWRDGNPAHPLLLPVACCRHGAPCSLAIRSYQQRRGGPAHASAFRRVHVLGIAGIGKAQHAEPAAPAAAQRGAEHCVSAAPQCAEGTLGFNGIAVLPSPWPVACRLAEPHPGEPFVESFCIWRWVLRREVCCCWWWRHCCCCCCHWKLRSSALEIGAYVSFRPTGCRRACYGFGTSPPGAASSGATASRAAMPACSAP